MSFIYVVYIYSLSNYKIYQIKIPVPGVGYLPSIYWSGESQRCPQIIEATVISLSQLPGLVGKTKAYHTLRSQDKKKSSWS